MGVYDMHVFAQAFYIVISRSILTSHNIKYCILLSSAGVEVTYIIIVIAVILTLAVAGLTISLYIRYSKQTHLFMQRDF